MIIIAKFKDVFKKALLTGSSPERLTKSFCTGIFIAFSPFPGGHTIMMLIAKYLFDLHFPTLFISASINNPWTMIPFFTFDYAFGYWFVHSLLGFNPGWNISLAKIFGSGSICVWSFFVGGMVLSICTALICYPVMYKVFSRLAKSTTEPLPTNPQANQLP